MKLAREQPLLDNCRIRIWKHDPRSGCVGVDGFPEQAFYRSVPDSEPVLRDSIQPNGKHLALAHEQREDSFAPGSAVVLAPRDAAPPADSCLTCQATASADIAPESIARSGMMVTSPGQ